MKNVFPADCEKQCPRWYGGFSLFAFSCILRYGRCWKSLLLQPTRANITAHGTPMKIDNVAIQSVLKASWFNKQLT